MNEYQYILTYDGTPETLTINPDGWNEIGVSFERSPTYSGILRFYSFPLRFVRKSGGGGDIIKTAYDSDGIETEVSIEVKKRNPQTSDYDSKFTGILDFKEESFTIERDIIEINVIDGSKQQKFVSRDEINYDLNSLKSTDDVTIDSFSGQPIWINFDPVNIFLNAQTTGNWDHEKTFSYLLGLDSFFSYYYSNDIIFNELGDRLKTNDGPNQDDRTAMIYKNETNGNVILKVINSNIISDTSYFHHDPVIASNHSEITVQVGIMMYNNDDILVSQKLIFNETYITNDLSGPTNIPINFNLNLAVSDWELEQDWYLNYIIFINPDELTWEADTVTYVNNMEISLYLTEISESIPQTSIKGFLPHEAFTRLIQLITSETNTNKLFYSEFFGRTDSEFEIYSINGQGALDFITSGYNSRGYPDRALNVNFKDLFNTFNGFYNLGVGFDYINDRFYIEEKQNFYKSGYFMFEIENVKDLKIKPVGEEYYSQILSGLNDKVEYEEVQGANEYNVQSEHSISIPVNNKLEIRIPYRTDTIAIELARRKQYENYLSEDTKYDDLIFIVRTDGNTVIQNGTGVTGFEGIELYYNIKLTPRENLIRWASVLKIPLWKTAPLVKFVKSQKDINITYTNQNNDIVNEFDDIQASELKEDRLFNPEIYTFEAPLTSDMVDILLTDPHGYVEFTFDNVVYNGFIRKIESKDYPEEATWELYGKDVPVGNNFIFEDGDNYILESDNNLIFEE